MTTESKIFEIDKDNIITHYYNKKKVDNLVIPDETIKGIKDGKYIFEARKTVAVFANDTKLKEITLPDSLTYIGDYAFANCENLEKIIMNNVEHIGKFAFSGCSKLKSITLPENLKTIDSFAFSHCNFESIIIPNNVETIGNNAFDDCGKESGENLKLIEFGQNVKYIGEDCLQISFPPTQPLEITFNLNNEDKLSLNNFFIYNNRSFQPIVNIINVKDRFGSIIKFEKKDAHGEIEIEPTSLTQYYVEVESIRKKEEKKTDIIESEDILKLEDISLDFLNTTNEDRKKIKEHILNIFSLNEKTTAFKSKTDTVITQLKNRIGDDPLSIIVDTKIDTQTQKGFKYTMIKKGFIHNISPFSKSHDGRNKSKRISSKRKSKLKRKSKRKSSKKISSKSKSKRKRKSKSKLYLLK